MALAVGTRFGPYEIVGGIGAGGMGEVYRARDARLGRDVAIKVLPASLVTDQDRLRRFEQEARATAALNHPNILAVYDVGSHDGMPYVVYELLDGGTLRERLPQGSTSVRKAAELAVQIARGLAAAHERNIVHRDLKPDNIFVTTDGRGKILNFGLAKLVEADPASSEARSTTVNLDTTPGTVLGTVGYMSPEQVRGLPVDPHTDIFALGIVVYEMLAGRRPFQGSTTADTIAAIVKEDPADLPAVERHIPAGLERIVDRCLEKTPSARFQTASDLGFALEALSSSSDRVDRVSESVMASGGRSASRLAWTVAALSLAGARGGRRCGRRAPAGNERTG
jgi:serine/threonine protein kinase